MGTGVGTGVLDRCFFPFPFSFLEGLLNPSIAVAAFKLGRI